MTRYPARVLSALLSEADVGARRYLVSVCRQHASLEPAAEELGVGLRTLQRWLAGLPDDLRADALSGAGERAQSGRRGGASCWSQGLS